MLFVTNSCNYYCQVIFVQLLGIVTTENNADVLFIVICATKNLLVTCYWGPKIVKITPLFLTGYPRNVPIISLLVTCSKKWTVMINMLLVVESVEIVTVNMFMLMFMLMLGVHAHGHVSIHAQVHVHNNTHINNKVRVTYFVHVQVHVHVYVHVNVHVHVHVHVHCYFF
jgi:hypothetical protein